MKKIILTIGMVIISLIKFPFKVLTAVFSFAIVVLGLSNIIPLLATIVAVVTMMVIGIQDVFNGGGVMQAVIYGVINVGLVGGVVALGFTIWITAASALMKVCSKVESISSKTERFLGRGLSYCQRMLSLD